jgi:hypothetical protein
MHEFPPLKAKGAAGAAKSFVWKYVSMVVFTQFASGHAFPHSVG